MSVSNRRFKEGKFQDFMKLCEMLLEEECDYDIKTICEWTPKTLKKYFSWWKTI